MFSGFDPFMSFGLRIGRKFSVADQRRMHAHYWLFF